MTKPIRILYYLPGSDLTEREKLYRLNMYRGEMAYGVFHLKDHGTTIIELSPPRDWHSKLSRIWYAMYLLINCHKYDIIYSPYFSGLEYVIKLRGLRLFPKKIMVWHHSPIVSDNHSLKAKYSQQLFFRGCDALFMFSEAIKAKSLQSEINLRNKVFVLNWGPDMSFYDRIRLPYHSGGEIFMSGIDSRDFDTMYKVCQRLPQKHFMVIPPTEELEIKFRQYKNVTTKRYPASFESYYHLALETAKASLVLILTKPVEGRSLPSGLTSICEATGLAKPCIITKNPYFSQELIKAGFAAFVDIGDSEGICRQIEILTSDEDTLTKMSACSLNYALQNDIKKMARQLADIIKTIEHNE